MNNDEQTVDTDASDNNNVVIGEAVESGGLYKVLIDDAFNLNVGLGEFVMVISKNHRIETKEFPDANNNKVKFSMWIGLEILSKDEIIPMNGFPVEEWNNVFARVS